MTNEYIHSTDTEQHRTIDNTSGKLMPTHAKKIDLATVDDVRLEMARVYPDMKCGAIETSDGSRLVYTLSAIAKMIEIHDIEKRIALLEGNNIGNS
jgi:hypothetical protein